MPADRTELGAFLRSRRDRLSPAQAGIPAFPGPRRVPGLRKEEVAVLAAMSTDHYSRLEQGRQEAVSDDVVDALARALRLDEVEHAHLRDLAAPVRRRRTTAGAPAQRADPGLLRVMAALDHLPVLLLGQRSQVLARNALLVAVLGVDLPPGTVFARYLLTDPRARARITNWDRFAAAVVGGLRLELGRRPDDRALIALVDELRDADPSIAHWWDERVVADHTSLRKHVAHPQAGPLVFGIEALSPPHDPSQRLVVYTAEVDSDTARVLPLLRSWVDSAVGVEGGDC